MPATSSGMTVSYQKNWIAKDFIQSILNQIIENPVFLYAHFGHIIEYIRKNEIEDQSVDDIEIVRNLSPIRFVIVDEEAKPPKPQIDYHMDDEYFLPESYSQIKYTDFRVHFLAKNDPLVLQSESKSSYEHVEDDQMPSDSNLNGKIKSKDERKTDSKHEEPYGLWVRIYRLPNLKLFTHKIRVVIEEGESFKDLILRDIWPYLEMNKMHSLSPTNAPKDKDNDNKTENEQDDLMKSIIESKVRFRVFGVRKNKEGISVKGELLNRPNIGNSLTEDMWLQVYLPNEEADDST